MKRIKVVFVCLLLILSLNSVFAKNTFALVLSGGGARGIAHIAVIQELEKRGIVPDLIVGTSMGALVGGFYAAGWTGAEIEQLVLSNDLLGKMMIINNKPGQASFTSPDSLFEDNILVLEFGPNGIGSANGILDDQQVNGFIRENLMKVLDIDDFDDLSIPFRAIGADVTNGGEIIFEDGSLYTALRSSMSLPIIFPPVKLDDTTYVMDGGLVNNLPVNVAKDLGADIILAVDVNDALNSLTPVSSEKMETLSGSISAFTRSLNMSNSVPQYEIADWVLVPDVDEFDTVEFDKAQAILDAGRECVYENIAIFDKLERMLRYNPQKDFELYADRDNPIVMSINKGGVKGFSNELYEFVGEEFSPEAATRFESILSDIKYRNRLKDLSYEFADGVITLIPTYYNTLDGSFSLGLRGGVGLEYNGYDNPFFVVLPTISASVQYHVTPKAIISAGLVYHDTLSFQTRFSTPIGATSYYYAGIDLDYLNLSIISYPTKNGHLVRNDTGASFNTGFFWDVSSAFVANLSIGFDYSHLTGFVDPVDNKVLFPYSNISYGYALASVDYNTLDETNAMTSGANINLKFDVGFDIDYGKDDPFSLGYGLKAKASFVFGQYLNPVMGIFDAEMSTIRRHPFLSDSYVSTKGGIPTSDYVFGAIGARIGLPFANMFIDIAPFVEFYQKDSADLGDMMSRKMDYIPFVGIDEWTLGAKISVGTSTSIGIVSLDCYFGGSDTFRCSVLLGIR